MEQSTHEIRRANRYGIISACKKRPASMSVRQWLAKNGVKEKAYYYWLRKFHKEAYDQMLPAVLETTDVAFTEITLPVKKSFTQTPHV
ncbi:MAG: hypothetical protein NC489_37980 [Ruminococcus flavefaciens]|nr:hypothetical protein [Ruminococcus flavefaciens]